MKKILFLILLSIGVVKFVNAQFIDVIGNGVLNEENPTLTIPNMETVDHVVVEVTAEFEQVYVVDQVIYQTPNPVYFSSGVNSKAAIFNNIDINKSPFLVFEDQYWKLPWDSKVVSLGYYTATFSKNQIVNGEITLNKNGQGNNILSFYAYIYRTDGTINKLSLISENRAFVWHNVNDKDLVTHEFDLPISQTIRDIEVIIPFSDNFESNTADDRIAVVFLMNGDQELSVEEFNLNQGFTNFLIKSILLNNVPVDVTKIKVVIYSPVDNGDSFFAGMPILTYTVEEKDPGCTRTIGYWKTHSKYGPAKKADATWDLILPNGPDAPFFLSGKTYFQVLGTAPRGNPYYILAHQYIAAELNFLAGAYNGAVDDEFTAAKVLLQTFTPAQVPSMANNDANINTFTTLGGILDNYNNGIIGPGHCDDIQEKSARISDENGLVQPSEFAVYPNPVANNAIVSFNPVNDGLATVELYNSVGQKAGRILQQNVLKGIQVKAAFIGLELNKGLYFMVLQNGNYTETVKVSITR